MSETKGKSKTEKRKKLEDKISRLSKCDESLKDIVWFARTMPKTAIIIDDKHDFKHNKRFPLKRTINFDGYKEIILLFQIDRYSKLPFVARKYVAESPIYKKEKLGSKKEVEKRSDELLDLKICNGVLEDTKKLTVKYRVDVKFTVGDILDYIYKFYASEMPIDELKAVSETEDPFGYTELAKNALKNGTVLYRHQVMGDCMRFEFLSFKRKRKNSPPEYRVVFGS